MTVMIDDYYYSLSCFDHRRSISAPAAHLNLAAAAAALVALTTIHSGYY
jgi:hypothetical protein